jgi:hypothetical protein
MPVTSNQSGTVRPGWPSLNRTMPPAPDRSATLNFWANVHVPRWTRAMAPSGIPL